MFHKLIVLGKLHNLPSIDKHHGVIKLPTKTKTQSYYIHEEDVILKELDRKHRTKLYRLKVKSCSVKFNQIIKLQLKSLKSL